MTGIHELFEGMGVDLGGKPKADGTAALAKMLQQAVTGERKALKRIAELEGRIETLKRKAQNNIDRSYNRGVRAAMHRSEPPGYRTVRFPEYGTS